MAAGISKAKVIWKFPIAIVSPYQVTMPKDAEILTVQQQGDQAYLWAIVDPSAEKERRVLEILGTGQFWRDAQRRKYIGTFQQPPFVWHVFENIEIGANSK